MSVEELYPYTTVIDSIIEKDWACGSRDQITTQEFIIREGGGEYATVTYSPAWWKIIDEPIVNAIDHFIRCLNGPTPVTTIKIDFEKSGKVRIFNDGPGILIQKHKVASEKLGREIWSPTLIFGEAFQGSNRAREDDSIIGGTNGLGAKLSVCFSTEAIVETVDTTGMYFLQRWRDHKSVEEPPTIINLKGKHSIPLARTKPHTVLSFTPDYVGLFGYAASADVYSPLVDLVRTRAYFAAAYISYTLGAKKTTAVWFNGQEIKAGGMNDIAKLLFPTATIMRSIVTPAASKSKTSIRHYKYPWEVYVIITDTQKYANSRISIVNGIVVQDGKHLDKISQCIVAGATEKITKYLGESHIKFSPQYITSNIFLMINTKIPNPSWTGQRKDVMGTDIRMFANYSLESKFITDIANAIKDNIIDSIFAKPVKKKNGGARGTTDYEKYEKAKLAGSKSSHLCALLPVEGDSAKNQIVSALTKTLGMERFGVISTAGVLINTRRECSVVETGTMKHVKLSNKITNNAFIKAFLEVTGLDPAFHYDPTSPTYKKEMGKLNYGRIIICVDQDMDGKGNILGLLLSMIERLWPKLFSAGYVQWFSTPIIRAFPKTGSVVKEFYNMIEYNKWSASACVTNYNISYYKGWGTHSPKETVRMFQTFNERLFTYYTDDDTRKYFDIYFGDDPELRKIELSKPPLALADDIIEEQERTKRISCTHQLLADTDEYQRDNLDRKLDHIIDGQNQAGRKILDGVMKLCGAGKTRVEKLAGPISERENYHHGGASLEHSIQGKAFVAVGGKQLPILLPESQLGSRICGGAEAASARYTDVTLNSKLTSVLFPQEDYCLLSFNFDEGHRGEPDYFVPIIPIVICESTCIPAHGWKLKLWARDVFKVIENVRRLIRIDDAAPLLLMPPCKNKGTEFEWKGEFKTIRGEPYSLGRYEIVDKSTIRITELPLRVWTNTYMDMLKKKVASCDFIESIDKGNSNDYIVDISIKIKPHGWDILESRGDELIDGIEEFFQLRSKMSSNINLINIDNSVIEFKDYGKVMYHWFPIRKKFYGLRIDRKIIILSLQIRRWNNILRYIAEYKRLGLPGKKIAEMNDILVKAKFDKIYKSLLDTPGFEKTELLEDLILRSANSNYSYLLDLTDSNKSAESIVTFQRKLLECEEKLADIKAVAAEGRFRGATLFEREIDELEAVLTEGYRTNWQFKNAGRFTYG